MADRSPARWLAPLVLAGLVVTIVWVVSSSTGGDPSPAGGGSSQTTRAGSAKKTTKAKRRSTAPRTYTVQEGDILSTVAEKTGVSVERIQELNPDVDSNALTIGQRLRLSAPGR